MWSKTDALVSMFGCVLLFGLQFTPAKRNETYNGILFHWFMCSGSLFTGIVLGAALEGDFPVGSLEGMFGGALVAISNTLVLHVKRTLGMFSGVVIYQTANLLTGYSVGRFGLLGARCDPGRIPLLRDAGIAVFLLSLGLAFLANPQARGRAVLLSAPMDFEDEDEGGLEVVRTEQELGHNFGSVLYPRADPTEVGVSPEGTAGPTQQAGPTATGLVSPTGLRRQLGRRERSCLQKCVGAALALVAGFLRGLNPVPFYVWQLSNSGRRKGVFVFPQALGVWVAGTVIYLGYASGKKMFRMASPHHPHIRPAFLSGCLWSCGFVCFAIALDGFGPTATYTLSVTGSMFVSQLLSVIAFREITDRYHLQLFTLCCTVQAASMALVIAGT